MGIINILDKQTAELIAAGEVVDRPASVVKELCENSIDAGCRRITVEIRSGGCGFIRVMDDGEGIAPEDVKKAFLRHATSKISSSGDLTSISTLGFRGEALASIAAVSRVEMLTRKKGEEFGVGYSISGGEEQSFDYAGCPEGTTIVVRDLFYNTPARMKFLKKNVSEGNAVADIVDKLALSNPHISFKFIRDGEIRLSSPGDGKLISAIWAVYGSKFSDELIEVSSSDSSAVKVNGFVSLPRASKATRAAQVFFINGRYFKSKICTTALEQAYKGMIMTGKFPSAVINISVPYTLVDVNVHPAKTEVRFSDEKIVFDAIYYAVKNALMKVDNISGNQKSSFGDISPKQYVNTEISVSSTGSSNGEKMHSSGTGKAGKTPHAAKETRTSYDSRTSVWDILGNIKKEKISSDDKPEKTDLREEIEGEIKPFIDDIRFIGEAFSLYIIAQRGEELIIVDKHAAHERILYNSLIKGSISSDRQLLLEPVIMSLSRDQVQTIEDNQETVMSLGFSVETFGETAVIIREVPTFVSDIDFRPIIEEIAQKLSENRDVTPDLFESLCESVACHSALRGNDKSTEADAEALLKTVVLDGDISHCPHGRPVVTVITKRQLEKMFGRLG